MFNTNKNKQQNYHDALANSINRKKTIHNDVLRFKNIHSKINTYVNLKMNNKNNVTYRSVDKDYINDKNMLDKDIIDKDIANSINCQDLYKINTNQYSVTLDLNLKNNNNHVNMPKIVLKDIVIPNYSNSDIYDIKNVGKNINTIIDMQSDLELKDENGNTNTIENNSYLLYITQLHNKNVKVIHNVYQESYADDFKPTGFGDFIRGCFFLLQFCRKYNFQYKIIINHPIAIFLEKFCSFYNTVNSTRLLKFTPIFLENNWNNSKFDSDNYIIGSISNNQTISNFTGYLSTLQVINSAIFSYNIMFPYDNIIEDHKKHMRYLLQPTEEMKLYINHTLETIGLSKNKYSVIHIRSGDKYLNNSSKVFDTAYIKKIVYELKKIIHYNSDKHFLLIADNNEIKLFLMEIFPTIKVIFKNITHLGEGTVLERDKVKNTLLDFYLMSYSYAIYSYTCYAHGSGFSYWCAKIYNIPHKCMYVCV